MRKTVTTVGILLAMLGLLAAWADATPVASLAETRPLAAGAALGAAALLALRWRRGGPSPTVRVGLGVAAAALAWSLYLLAFAYHSEDVTFAGAGATLAGTLYLPPSAGPHPAAVFLHGSGPGPRQGFAFQAKLLARHGIAALVYDKRGSGASGGELWVPYAAYAADAVAARRALAAHPAVDAARIGFFGHSEGGWVAPIAAAAEGCAFLVATGTTHLPPADQVLYESLAQVRAAGFGEEVAARVETLQRDLFAYQRTGEARPRLEEELAAAATEPWAGPAELPGRLWPAEEYAWWRLQSQARIAEAVAAGGGPEVTSVVFPEADHVVLEWPLGEGVPPPRWPEGYREALVCWTRAEVGLPPTANCAGRG